MAEQDPDLEHEIIRRIQAHNYAVRNQLGFNLPIGCRVYILNPKDTLLKRRSAVKPYIGTITGMVGSIYLVRTPNRIEKYSRYQLKPV
jgi:Iap family predicted aminopeptidase